MKREKKIRVGISIGDLNGIGSEIILKSLSENLLLDFCTPVVFASVKTLSYIKRALSLELKIQGIDHLNKVIDGKINVYNVWKEGIQINWGNPSEESGKYALTSFQSSVKALKDGLIDVLVTAPIDKATIQTKDFAFPGHTDYLEKELEGDAMMLMITDTLKIGLLTDHIPVKDVPAAITPDLIKKKVNTLYSTLQSDFGIRKPKIALLSINPHIGDNGVIGSDDDETLIPTLDEIRKTGKIVYGPYAADSFFGSGNYKNFDAILAAYHDQGLIPFKTLSFGKGVNYTAGLDKIRTSPDHGTAYDIAGKGKANHSSFTAAIFDAIHIFKARNEHKELTANILKPLGKKVTQRNRNGRDHKNDTASAK